MSFYAKGYVFLLILSSHYVFGIVTLPTCKCECCPGLDCLSQLLVFSVDVCNNTSCTFDQCYRMYPRKCGLRPGITNSYCNILNQTTVTTIATTKQRILMIPFENTTLTSSSSNLLYSILLIFFSCLVNFI